MSIEDRANLCVERLGAVLGRGKEKNLCFSGIRCINRWFGVELLEY